MQAAQLLQAVMLSQLDLHTSVHSHVLAHVTQTICMHILVHMDVLSCCVRICYNIHVLLLVNILGWLLVYFNTISFL